MFSRKEFSRSESGCRIGTDIFPKDGQIFLSAYPGVVIDDEGKNRVKVQICLEEVCRNA